MTFTLIWPFCPFNFELKRQYLDNLPILITNETEFEVKLCKSDHFNHVAFFLFFFFLSKKEI